MRPKIRGDTFYFPTAEGIFLRNNQRSYVLKGKGVSRLLDILVPYLNGQHTLDEITQNLPPGRQETVIKLITLLVNKGFFQDLSHDLPHNLTLTEQEAYAAEIAFIGSFTDSAAHHFERYRLSRILLIGSGLTLTALVHAHLHSGLRQVNVMITDECATDTQRLYDYLTLYRERDKLQSVTEIERPDWSNEEAVQDAIQPFDAILHISDRPMLARAALLNRLCVQQRKSLLQAVIVEQNAWSGPLVEKEQSGCWECAWRRLQANMLDYTPYILKDRAEAPISDFVAAPTAAVVANLLGFEIFKHITGAGPLETAAHLIETDLETLQSERYSFLPHPLCETCQQPSPFPPADLQRAVEQLMKGSEIGQEQFSKAATSLFDSKLGLFSELDEKNFVQVPLNVAQVTVCNSMLLSNLPEPLKVTAVGTDFGVPRRRATQRACEMYAASLCDTRRLIGSQQLAAHVSTGKGPAVYTRDLSKTYRTEPDERYVWGYVLTTGEACALPAPVVFPVLQGVPASSKIPPGVASGRSWAEAVSRAILAHCKRLVIEQIGKAQEPFLQVDLAQVSLDDLGNRYRQMIEIMNLPVTVYDVTGESGVPTFAFVNAGETIAYACHLDPQKALSEGLERIIQQSQSIANQQPAYALLPVPPVPANLRSSHMTLLHSPLSPGWSWSTIQAYLLNALEHQGYTAIAVPLDHDPELIKILPYIVRVVIVPHNTKEEV